jgi:tryptophanyl-tRNA synthetase
VPEVCELTWLIGSLTPMGLLERAHSYKDKTAKGISPNFGLFAYPVLMAADILLYDTNVVPVGRDQKQHLEMTRDIAIKFNQTYGEVFVVPEEQIRDEVAVVPGLDGQKMSKSYGNTIDIFGEEKETRKRVMSIVTDSTPVESPKNPDTSALVQLFSLFASEAEAKAMRDAFRKGGTGYGEFKKQLAGRLWDYFEPMRKRRAEILADPGYIDQVLKRGATRATEAADQVMARVREAVGL